MTWSDLTLIAPFAAAVAVAALVILADIVMPGNRHLALGVVLAGLIGVGLLVLWTGQTPGTAFGGMYKVDNLTTFLDTIFVAIAAITCLFAPDYLEPRGLPIAEFAAILVFALGGAMLVSASADLIVLFVGLELMVIPGYLLAGYHKRDALSTEGAVKYFLLGLVLQRHLPVRPRLRLGPDRVHPDRRRGGSDRRDRRRAGDPLARARDGPGLPDDRVSRSRWPPSRSTTGRPTRTRARRRP